MATIKTGQIAFETDDASRIVTVVYFGPVTEQDVLDFYAADTLSVHIIECYDFLVDQRHTYYQAPEGAIERLGQMLRARLGGARLDTSKRRIALVRREQPDTFVMTHGAPMRQEFGSELVRYFNDMDEARAWLGQGRDARAGKNV